MNNLFFEEFGTQLKDVLTIETDKYRNKINNMRKGMKRYHQAEPRGEMMNDFSFMMPFDDNFTAYQDAMISFGIYTILGFIF